MNFLSVITQYNPVIDYATFNDQAWENVIMSFGVEKQLESSFLESMKVVTFNYEYKINTVSNFNEIILSLDSTHFIFLLHKEFWKPNFLRNLSTFFFKRQYSGSCPRVLDKPVIDEISSTRHLFYFMGSIDFGRKNMPITALVPNLHDDFELLKVLERPVYFQPGIKWLYPTLFIQDQKIILHNYSSNFNLNISIFTLNLISYIYKLNNYFESEYYASYLDFVNEQDDSNSQTDVDLYLSEVSAKESIYTHEKGSEMANTFKKILKSMDF